MVLSCQKDTVQTAPENVEGKHMKRTVEEQINGMKDFGNGKRDASGAYVSFR